MPPRLLFASSLTAVLLAPVAFVLACCPAPPSGKPVVNADQTVILLWDAETKTQHFIRRASFKAEAEDFGFLVPTPTQPELSESGDGAFPVLAAITAPEVQTIPRPTGGGCGCSDSTAIAPGKASDVIVLEERTVAGFSAVVLDAKSSEGLIEWLKSNGYAFSPEVRAWAEPYVQQGWKITALKVAPKSSPAATRLTSTPADYDVSAASLRISFKTDRPVFPYREPDPTEAARQLGVSSRLLRIYFLAEARYQGQLTPTEPWSGQVAWAGKVSAADRERMLELLGFPASTGPSDWWMTEFEDNWQYRAAPADVYFSRSPNQSAVARPPIMRYAEAAPIDLAEAMPYVLVVAIVGLMPVFRRLVGRVRG